MNAINEKFLNDYPMPIFLEETETILNQMKESVCEICLKDGRGTGFFCNIPMEKDKFISVFITNNHVINEEYLTKEDSILIKMNDGKKTERINIKDSLTYTNKEYDVTIIEFKENFIKDFLELDENINNDPAYYMGKSVYTLQYPNFFEKEKVAVSYGILKDISEDSKYNFRHYCSTESGSSGSPILNLSNNKLIGIHKQCYEKHQFNVGAFLNISIKEFINKYQNKNLKVKSDFIPINNINYSPLKINPFEYFKIEKENYKNLILNNELIINLFNKFKNSNHNNDVNPLLNYYTLYNMNKFDRNGDEFIFKKKDHFYYVIMNDLDNLKSLYEQNKYILCQKDNYKNTLLHLSVLGEYLSITKFLLDKGINYDEPNYFGKTALSYSKGIIYELLIKFGAQMKFYNSKGAPKGININIKDENKLYLIWKQLKNCISKMEIIKNNGEIIAKRLFRNIGINSKNLTNNWIPVYHGAKFVSMEQILKYGLHNSGEPSYGYIKSGETIFGVNNWTNSIFVSPSIFYASKFSEIINSDREDWYIIIEAFVDPKFFRTYQSTIYQYNLKLEEPKILEYRYNISISNDTNIYGDQKGIYTNSLLFVKRAYLEKAENYSFQKIFENCLKDILEEIIQLNMINNNDFY